MQLRDIDLPKRKKIHTEKFNYKLKKWSHFFCIQRWKIPVILKIKIIIFLVALYRGIQRDYDNNSVLYLLTITNHLSYYYSWCSYLYILIIILKSQLFYCYYIYFSKCYLFGVFHNHRHQLLKRTTFILYTFYTEWADVLSWFSLSNFWMAFRLPSS